MCFLFKQAWRSLCSLTTFRIKTLDLLWGLLCSVSVWPFHGRSMKWQTPAKLWRTRSEAELCRNQIYPDLSMYGSWSTSFIRRTVAEGSAVMKMSRIGNPSFFPRWFAESGRGQRTTNSERVEKGAQIGDVAFARIESSAGRRVSYSSGRGEALVH